MAIESSAELFVATVDALARRAPAIVASAAHQMAGVTLGLRFGDGTRASLTPQQSRLVAVADAPDAPDVEVWFDERALHLLFDRARPPVDAVWPGSLDVRGEREHVLAAWRGMQLLSQRAAGLRAVQSMWRAYRDARPELWDAEPVTSANAAPPAPRDSRWRALEYLDRRHPEDTDRITTLSRGTIHVPTRELWDGRTSHRWAEVVLSSDADLMETMAACRARVREEVLRILPTHREPRAELYDLMAAYPAREGKGLRPTLTLATCAALWGATEDAVRTATAIELFHNGFLVHDDISDESTHRRNEPTLHEAHGVGLAVNTGDALNLLAVDTVLSNLESIGLARTLGLIQEVLHMCRETVEGQAIELGWIRAHAVPERDEDYFNMSTKKTGWYTCISPCRLGAICAGVTEPRLLDRFIEPFRLIGIAFQIQDDVLNLIGEEELYGKEPLGDLLEGKRTVMLLHLFRSAKSGERERLQEILATRRQDKRFADAQELLAAMERHGSIEYAIQLADRLAHAGVERFESDLDLLPENEAKAVLRQIANYVTTRPL